MRLLLRASLRTRALKARANAEESDEHSASKVRGKTSTPAFHGTGWLQYTRTLHLLAAAADNSK